MANEKIKILGAVLDYQLNSIADLANLAQFLGINELDWQCCLAGSSKTAPRILIFSIVTVADYSFYEKTINTHACAFLTLNIF